MNCRCIRSTCSRTISCPSPPTPRSPPSAITADLPQTALRGTMEYLTALNSLGDAVDAQTKTAIREKISGLYTAAIAKAKADEKPNKKLIDSLENNVAFLNGAFSRGELIDHKIGRASCRERV